MTSSQAYYSGWDIGGAHVKVSRCDWQGNIIQSLELPCQLWKGITGLSETLKKLLQQLDNQADKHFITLTGESADCFTNRQQGVVQILDCVQQLIESDNCVVFSQSQDWLTISQAQQSWQQVASMNWLATATWLGIATPDALLIDIGSTTADLICIIDGKPTLKGFTDQARLQSGELVYTGVIRTPLMALAQEVPFSGLHQRVANEVFATTADVWRLQNMLPIDIADSSADGQSWQAQHCQQRLARMVGSDVENYSKETWQELAEWYGQQQIQQLLQACQQVIGTHKLMPEAPVIGAGVGRFLALALAQQLNRPYLDMADLQLNAQATIGAPASALALLGWRQFT